MPLNADRRKRLVKLTPEGVIITRSWLIKQGFNRHAIDNLVKGDQLKALSNGVYSRTDEPKSWQSVVYALQNILNLDCVVGGLTALEIHGLSHYVSMARQKVIHLYSTKSLPKWVNQLSSEISFVKHSSRDLSVDHTAFTTRREWKENMPGLVLSIPERAFLEILLDVPENISFEHADEIMQGLTSLSPRSLQGLLEKCDSIKVKRLFLWLAERYNYTWLQKLNLEKINLGSGNRVLFKGGKLDKKYKITVPESL